MDIQKLEIVPREIKAALDGVFKNAKDAGWGVKGTYTMLLDIKTWGRGSRQDLGVLRQWAADNPQKYVRALANGYTCEEEERIVLEVFEMLNIWLNNPYEEDDEPEDIRLFARKLTNYFTEKLSKSS
ncbi:hypothetical protein [Heyndrickxia acidiproducens]|uniref:hypothetical protein n=1 Tax=Heyndrickxia acidiproducens TaxID=1121084 RepID=UPI00037447D0|nr:hypothetical protein [Heyndrickxia acidiproducens]